MCHVCVLYVGVGACVCLTLCSLYHIHVCYCTDVTIAGIFKYEAYPDVIVDLKSVSSLWEQKVSVWCAV